MLHAELPGMIFFVEINVCSLLLLPDSIRSRRDLSHALKMAAKPGHFLTGEITHAYKKVYQDP